MNLHGTPITSEDQRKILTPRWIDPATAERALLRRVDSPTGGELVGRNGAGNYEGIAIPYFLPGESHHREFRLRRDHPDMEYRDGKMKESRKYISPPGRTNMIYFIPGASPELLKDVELPVIVTEGEFTRAVASREPRSGHPTIRSDWPWWRLELEGDCR